MPKIRNTSDEDRNVPGFGLVEADAVVDVPEHLVYAFTCQEIWEPEDSEALEIHETASNG